MIKAIIFDFGDVFLNLDKAATGRKLKEMNIEELPENIHTYNRDYEQGLVTSDEIASYYKTHFPELTHENFLDSWNAILLDLPEYRLKFIEKLAQQKNYRLILLSNTNANHIEHIKAHVPHYDAFKNCFDAFYLSHEIGLRKPDPAIFKFVLDKNNLQAEECLFIDDTLEHIESAKNLGFHTWNLEPTREDVIDLFTTKNELF